MTDLEARLRALRHPPGHGPPPEELRHRAARRSVRRRTILLAVPLVVLAGVGLVWAFQEERADDVVTGPDEEEPAAAGVRTLGGVEGVTVSVTPRDELRDGQVVEVHIEGLDRLPGASIVLCAGDVSERDTTLLCDQVAVQHPGPEPGAASVVEGTQTVSLARIIRVTRSDDPNQPVRYDCAVEPAGCVLAVGPLEPPARAVLVPVSFRYDPLPDPVASVEPASGLADGQHVSVTGHGLRPNYRFGIQLCHVERGEVCDVLDWPTASSDDTGALETTVQVHAAIYGHGGRVDCTAEACAVVISDGDDRLVEIPFTFAPGVAAPVPELRLEPPGPYREGEVVTIHGTGFRPGFDVSAHIGQCPAHLDTAVEERCAYPFPFDGPVVVDDDGTFTATFSPTVSLMFTGSCVGEPGCVLAWVILKGPIAASAPLDFAP